VSEQIVIRQSRDIADLVNSGRIKGGNSTFVVLMALAGIFMDAYDFTSIAFGLSYIQKSFAISTLLLGIVSGTVLVGALVGSLTGGFLADRIGRYRVFTADLVLLIIATLLCAVAPNWWFLLIARFFMGAAVGIDYPVALSFISEYSSQKGKGRATNMYAPVWYVAVASTYVLLLVGYLAFTAGGWDISQLWRLVVAFGVVPTVIVLLLRRKYLSESPLWLATNDLQAAAAVLRRAYGVDAIVADGAVAGTPGGSRIRLPSGEAFAMLWRGKYRVRTVLSLFVNFCQGTEYYAVGFSLTLVTEEVIGKGTLIGIVGPLILNIIFGVAGGLVGAFLAPRVGIWKLALFGFVGTCSSLLLVSFLGRSPFPGAIWLAGLFLGVFLFSHAFGPGTQGVVFPTLSYPTSFRGAGVGFAQTGNRVGGALGLVFWPALSDAFGLNAVALLAVMPLIGFASLLVFRWDPTFVNVDVDDYVDDPAHTDTTDFKVGDAGLQVS